MGADAEMVVVGHGRGVEEGDSVTREGAGDVTVGPPVGSAVASKDTVVLAPVGAAVGDEGLQPASNTRSPVKSMPERFTMAAMTLPIKAQVAGSADPPRGLELGYATSTTRE